MARECVKDQWKCLLLLYITISLFCLSKCKTNVVTKLVFENSCHTLVRWWCKGIYKILTIGIKRRKKSYYNVKIEDTVCPNFSQKKAVLQNYLIQHNIPFSATDTKKVLYEKIKQKKTPVVYKTDKIANLCGHEVLRTPVWHWT